ncbi:MAG: tape measure protein [Acinetobacter sp.]
MAESVLRIVIDSRNAERNARNVANELQNIERNGDHASRSMDSMSVATRSLVGYMGGLVTIGAAISKMDAYTGLQNRLKLVTDSQVELNTAMNDTFGIAQKTAATWDSVAMVYQRFADNADRLGISMKQTAALTETVSKAISVSGGSAASAEAALMQFGQALASGVLRGEEFNSIAEQAPGLLKAIAMGMDTNIGSLRAMAAEGKITGDELVKALSKAKPYIDDLFNKTDFTIAQSFTQLSNEITKFVGAAGAGSGAAAGLSAAISGLANNLSTIANIAVIGGVALLTKTIAAQTVAIYGSITGVMARRAADLAALESQAQLAGLEVQRTRQVAALALTEVHLARQELNSATTRQARAAATMRLTQAEVALAIAEKQKTAATIADTAAQNANNAARSRGAMLLGLVGGPIGALTIGVTALAAGYMYFSNRAAEANAKLEEQASVAKKAKEELLALKGLEKDSAINDMTSAFERQNKALSESSSKINMQLNAIEQLYKGNKDVVQVVQDARNGTISMTEAVQRFNELRISKEVYESVKANSVEFEKNAKEATNTKAKLSLFGYEVELSGRKAQTAVAGVDADTEALNKNKTAAEKAAEAQKKFKASLFDREFEARLTKGLLAKGYTPEQVANMVQTANWAQKNNVKLTNELYQAGLQVLSIEEQNKKVIESKNAAEKKVTQEKEKQLKLGQRLIGISGNSGIGTGAHLDVRYGGSRDGQKVSKEHLARLEAGGKSLSNYRVSSDYGNRKAPTKGASSFHKGIDFAMPVDTPITTKVAVKDIKTAYDSKGGGYYSTVTFEDGVVLKLLHQSPSMMGEVKGGASDGTLKSHQDIEKQAEQQANSQLQLQMTVATERKRIEAQLQKDIEEINKAGFSPEETKRLTAEYQARADNDIAIAEYTLKTKLDDYSSFKKTEDELLKDSFDQKKFYAARDIELTNDQRDQAVKYLDEQYSHELGLIQLAKEQRIFQAEQAMMTEIQFMKERYRLEREEIIKTTATDLEERKRKLNALNTNTIRDGVGKNFSDPDDRGSQFLQSVDYAPISKSNSQRLDEEFEKERAKMLANFEKVKQLNADNHEAILEAERIFLEAKQQLQDEYDFKAQDARRLDYENQLNMYGSLLSLTGGVFDELAGIVSQYKDENTKTYKTMFAFQKAAAFAQAIVSTELAAIQVMADPTALTLAQKQMHANIIRLTGYASAGIIAAQAFMGPGGDGYANGGFTGYGGKFDPAGIVHKGEVVWSQEDIKRWGGVNVVEAMRTSQPPAGYSDGGIVNPRDTYRVGMGTVEAINRNSDVQAERQAQASAKSQQSSSNGMQGLTIINQIEQDDLVGNYMRGSAGGQIILNQIKASPSEFKRAMGV